MILFLKESSQEHDQNRQNHQGQQHDGDELARNPHAHDCHVMQNESFIVRDFAFLHAEFVFPCRQQAPFRPAFDRAGDHPYVTRQENPIVETRIGQMERVRKQRNQDQRQEQHAMQGADQVRPPDHLPSFGQKAAEI